MVHLVHHFPSADKLFITETLPVTSLKHQTYLLLAVPDRSSMDARHLFQISAYPPVKYLVQAQSILSAPSQGDFDGPFHVRCFCFRCIPAADIHRICILFRTKSKSDSIPCLYTLKFLTFLFWSSTQKWGLPPSSIFSTNGFNRIQEVIKGICYVMIPMATCDLLIVPTTSSLLLTFQWPVRHCVYHRSLRNTLLVFQLPYISLLVRGWPTMASCSAYTRITAESTIGLK